MPLLAVVDAPEYGIGEVDSDLGPVRIFPPACTANGQGVLRGNVRLCILAGRPGLKWRLKLRCRGLLTGIGAEIEIGTPSWRMFAQRNVLLVLLRLRLR